MLNSDHFFTLLQFHWLVDPRRFRQLQLLRQATLPKPFRIRVPRSLQRGQPLVLNMPGHPEMHIRRRMESDPRMPVMPVLRLDKPVHEISGISQRTELLREHRKILQGLEPSLAVDLTAGGRDIVATVAGIDQHSLGRYLLEELPRIPSVASVRSHPIARTLIDGRAWRVRALDAQESADVANLPLPTTSRSATRNPELERHMLELLNRDGRASATTLVRELDENPRHVRELMALMQRSGALIQRTDMVRSLSSWPVSAWHFIRVSATKLEGIGGRLENLPEVRLDSQTVGPHDLIMDVWLKDLSEVQRLEQALEVRLSGLVISDRSVVLRTVKQMGQILDDQGRSLGRSRL